MQFFGWSLLFYTETFDWLSFRKGQDGKNTVQRFVTVATTMATTITIIKNAIVTPVTTMRSVFFFEPKPTSCGLKNRRKTNENIFTRSSSVTFL